MASGTRRPSATKREGKATSRRAEGSGTRAAAVTNHKGDVTEDTKSNRDEGVHSRAKATTGVVKETATPAVAEASAESKVPPALPVPIASFTF
ncbi:MAG: hypothetical protein QOI66_4316 [Myxococcales bacterium]|jgi:hypothetical protein|nr:hypothetical protein [Myxococcales bacterium]